MSAIDLPESSVWHDVIQGIGPGDLASPGVGGPPNRAPQMLGDRTRWLRDQLKPEQTIILKQSSAMYVPANVWVNMLFQVVHRNDTTDALSVPLDYIRIPAGVTEVKIQGGVSLNVPVATTRCACAVLTLVNGASPVNAGWDAFNRYGVNFWPGANCHSGWIPVVANDRISLGVHSSVAAVTLSGTTPTYAEIIMR